MTEPQGDYADDGKEESGIYVVGGYRFGVKIGITRDLGHRMAALQAQIDKAVRLCFGAGNADRRNLVVAHFEAMDWRQAVRVERIVHQSLKRHDLGDELFNVPPPQAIKAVRLAVGGDNDKTEHRKLTGVTKAGKTWRNDKALHQFNYGKWPVDLIDRVRTIGENYGSQTKLARDALVAGLEDVRRGAAVDCGIHRNGKRFGFWIPADLMTEMRAAIAPPVTLCGFGIWSLSRMCDRLEGKAQ